MGQRNAVQANDERVAAILTNESQFRLRARALWKEAVGAGDLNTAVLCQRALADHAKSAEKVARMLADAEAQS